VFIGVGAAGTYARAAQDLYAEKRVETVTGARKAFYNVLLAHAVLGLLKQSMAFAEENLRSVRSLARQGLVAEYDLLRSEVSVSNILPEVIQAENAFRLSLNGLKIALGIPYDRPVAVDDTLALIIVPDSLMDRAVAMAVTDNRLLSALRRQTEINDAIIGAERSAYMPTLAAFGTYQWVLQTNVPKFAINDFISASTIGLTVSMNIFNGLQTNARVDQATLEFRKSQEQVTSVELATQTGTESTVGRLRRAMQRIQVQERTVEQAERGYRIATTRYTSGAGTLLEVNDANLAWINAKVNRIQAFYDYLVASADLDHLLGRVPAELTPIAP
jgi:outer membrane protein TolC